MSAAVDQAAIQSALSGLTRYQTQDLCNIVMNRVEWILRDRAMRLSTAQVERYPRDWDEDFYHLKPRLEAVLDAAVKDNLHVVVLTLGDIAGTLYDNHVALAADLLHQLADAIATLESRKGN